MTRLATHSVTAMTVILLTAAGTAAATGAGATARSPGGTSFSTDGALTGVTATSADTGTAPPG
jgi:hypothetical protein